MIFSLSSLYDMIVALRKRGKRMAKKVYKFEFCGRNITVETGEIAKQAGGSVLVRYEDTVVLSAATASKEAKDVDFFPLTNHRISILLWWSFRSMGRLRQDKREILGNRRKLTGNVKDKQQLHAYKKSISSSKTPCF